MNVAPWKPLLDRYPASIRPTSAVAPLGNAGGLSGTSLYRFESGRGPLVARRWPIDGPDRSRLTQIHACLKTANLGFVPLPVSTLDGATFVEIEGRFWQVEPWMPGQADLARPPSPEHLRAGFAGLAAFLSRFAPGRIEGPSVGLLNRVEEIERLMLGEFSRFRSVLERAPADELTALASRWLDRAVAMAPAVLEATHKAAGRPLPLQPCLRDARPDHLLFVGDRLTGLVDFGAMGRDSVAGDLARLLAEWTGQDRPARMEALAAFDAILPLCEAELRAIEVFQKANALLGAGHWARWHFLEGRKFDNPDAVIRGLARGLERLDESL